MQPATARYGLSANAEVFIPRLTPSIGCRRRICIPTCFAVVNTVAAPPRCRNIKVPLEGSPSPSPTNSVSPADSPVTPELAMFADVRPPTDNALRVSYSRSVAEISKNRQVLLSVLSSRIRRKFKEDPTGVSASIAIARFLDTWPLFPDEVRWSVVDSATRLSPSVYLSLFAMLK
jgi:hypothetical protein